MTTSDMAAATDLDASAVSRLILGRQNPSLATLVRVANAFGVHPSELLRPLKRKVPK